MIKTLPKNNTMNIFAEEDDKVIYIDENGYPNDTIYARDCGLVKGEIYTVDHTIVNQSSSDVYLKEFHNKGFNTVMFENYNE